MKYWKGGCMWKKKKEIKGLRHEIKILIPYAEYLNLSAKIRCGAERDSHAGEKGEYFIRSLYLDDMYQTAYVTKVNGVDNRKKYRIRCYDLSDEVIKFERKNKYNSRIQKVSFSMTRGQYDAFMNEEYDFLRDIDHPLAREVYLLTQTVRLAPSVIVDYDREAYIYPISNTRITFDKHLRAGIDSYDIFCPDVLTMPVFQGDSVILEVKYDTYMPSHLADMISSVMGTKMALSKFCMCKEKMITYGHSVI